MKDIMTLAREARLYLSGVGAYVCTDTELERFAALVRNQALEDAANEFAGEFTQSGEPIATGLLKLKEGV